MKNKKIKLILAISAMIFSTTNISAQTKIIAHRGYWNCEGSAQNSIAALKKAGEIKVYGSEFDVSITPDGKVIVNHDPDIQGHTIETTPYKELKNLKLSNGEKVPVLEKYLKEGKKYPDMQLILEIKPHKSILNEQRAVDATLKLVKKMKMEKQVEYISFSKYICNRIHQLSPSSKVAYLDAKMTPDEIKAEGWTGLDYYYNVIKKNPEWIEQSKKNGISVNVWTVDKSEDLQYFIDKGVDYITTNNPVEALKLAK